MRLVNKNAWALSRLIVGKTLSDCLLLRDSVLRSDGTVRTRPIASIRTVRPYYAVTGCSMSVYGRKLNCHRRRMPDTAVTQFFLAGASNMMAACFTNPIDVIKVPMTLTGSLKSIIFTHFCAKNK